MVRYILLLLLSLTSSLHAISYGSNSAPTRPSRLFFPNTGTDNTILGFAALDSGFFLEDYTTKCTYNDLFPIAGDVGLTGGSLYLLQDLVLSNTLNFITASGLIDAGSRSLELPVTTVDYSLPSIGSLGIFSPQQLSSPVMTAAVYSLDWNYNGQYVLAGSAASASTELQLYYFNGFTLTTTDMAPTTGEIGVAVNSIAWFPDDNYVAITNAASASDDLFVYYKRFNGSFSLRSTVPLNSGGQAVTWHPSGNYVVVGTDASPQVRSFSFNRTTGVVNTTAVSTLVAATVSRNAISFAPGGNYLAIGVSTSPQLRILGFTGAGVLSSATTLSPAVTVNAVDWCPTGTYVAAGLAATANSLRLYAYDVTGNTLTEVTSARVGETKSVNGLRWDPTGTFLTAVMSTGTAPQLRMFYFDKANLKLIEVYRNSTVLNTVNVVAWRRDGSAFAMGLATTFNVTVFGINHPSLWFDNTCLVMNANTNLYVPLTIKNNCKINGRGKRLTLQSGAEIVVRPGGSLILEDVELAGVGKSNLRCLTDAASITLCHAQLDLAHNLTLTRGALFVQETVAVTGTNALVLSSSLSTTINSGSMLYVGNGAMLQYAPPNTRRDLLYFTDPTSVLYLDHCSLVSTRTGLRLRGGTLLFDDAVTLSSQALYAAEGMSLVSTMTIDVRSGANVSVYGYVRVD